MEMPNGLTLKNLREREKAAFAEDSKWESMLSDIYDYFLPNRNLFDREDAGQKKADKIFDSTAVEAIQTGASKLQENIAPVWARWAVFEPSDLVLRELEEAKKRGGISVSEQEIRENLERQAEVVFDYINRSNFSSQFYEFALDLLVGTGTIKVDEVDDEDMPLSFSVIPQKGIAFEEGAHGKIETVFRRRKVLGSVLAREYEGLRLDEKYTKMIADDPTTKLDIHEAVVYMPQERVYYGIVWVKDDDTPSWVYNFEESTPMITARYFKVAGEVRGRGPAVQAIYDTKTLNKIKEFALQKAAIDLSGMWTGVDDGILNPYALEIQPGVVIPVSSNNSGNPSLMRVDTGADLNLTMFEVNELKESIRRMFFNDLRDPDGPVRSATEIAIDARELAKRIGSAFGRLQTEGLIPILQRVEWILARRGLISRLKVGSRDVKIKFVSPMARAQDMEDVLSAQQAIEFVLNTAGEDYVKVSFKTEKMGEWVAQKVGMPSELVRSETESNKVLQSGAKAKMMEAGIDPSTAG